MKRILIISIIILVANLLAGLVITAYSPLNLLFTSMVIVINTMLLAFAFIGRAESTHRLSLGFVFAGVGALEFITGFFAPEQWTNNWWLLCTIILTAVQSILLFLAVYYSKEV